MSLLSKRNEFSTSSWETPPSGLAGSGIGRGRQFVDLAGDRIGGRHRADLGADAAAVLERDEERRVAERLTRDEGVGVGRQVAEVGLLVADDAALALEID